MSLVPVVSLAAALALLCPTPLASAQRTPLLELNFESGSQRSFDSRGPQTKADKELDALLDGDEGPSFSSADLARVAGALRRYLDAARPRARPKLILFLYPGRISRSRLKTLREVKVAIEMVVDPCGRAACDASVATQLELLGKALKQEILRTRRYSLRFIDVTFRTRLDIRGAPLQVLRFKAGDVVAVGRGKGEGVRLVKKLRSAQAGYEQTMGTQITRRARRLRLRLRGVPAVTREGQTVSVFMEIGSDRVRFRQHVVEAMRSAVEALQQSPLTPTAIQLKVTARGTARGKKRREFSSSGHPLTLFINGRLTRAELWSTYIVEHKKKGQHFSFADDAPAARGSPGGSAPDRTAEILSGRTALFAPCLKAEAAKRRAFAGATMIFSINPSGRTERFSVKEKDVSAVFRRCMGRALSKVRFPARAGSSRQVEYPMYIQR